ncbi:MAG: ribosome biogenesis GTPase YlqF [Clostridia bacterium]|nr:ribosome biogenesis GTPase YlqF [Clostridia bacterium]
MTINWYPGHMAKAKRELAESLKLIDVVVEIVDARAPAASQNPDFDDLFASKSRVVLLNKSDLADPSVSKAWMKEYRTKGISAGEIVSTSNSGKALAVRLIEEAAREEVERMKAKGVNKTIRALVVGIPNVGKSTFINRIAGEARAKVGDKPGVTKGKQWVKITPYLELLDSPGLLWPKLENQIMARHLAYLGSIRDEVLELEELAWNLIRELRSICPDALYARFKKLDDNTPEEELLDAVAKSRGLILKGGVLDTERAAKILLDEFRSGKIGRITLETPIKTENQPAEVPDGKEE